MFGAVQLGILAACIVLFVPMGMAGWHLSRNKVLFFSCALFITLAVGVHLAPYFPLLSAFFSPSLVIPSPTGKSSSLPRDSCVSSLHCVVYRISNSECDDGDNGCEKKDWEWAQAGPVDQCEFQKLKKPDVSVLLNGSWVVVAGDSQLRLLVVSLLDLVMGQEGIERIRGDLFKRHSDYSISLDEIGLKLDFKWCPYVKNLTGLMMEFKERKNYPDVIVMGAGLWDMLHVNNVSDYGVSLNDLRQSMLAFLPVHVDEDADLNNLGAAEPELFKSPHLFWMGVPTLINSMLNTAEKKEKLNDAMCNAFDDKVNASKLLKNLGGPLTKLDIRTLSGLCGPRCTSDGMHYDEVVYDTAVQILLNALLIESNQKPQ